MSLKQEYPDTVRYLYDHGYPVIGDPTTRAVTTTLNGVIDLLGSFTNSPAIISPTGVRQVETILSSLGVGLGTKCPEVANQLLLSAGAIQLLTRGTGPGGEITLLTLEMEE